MDLKARDVIGAVLLTAVLIGLVAVLFFLAWQSVA